MKKLLITAVIFLAIVGCTEPRKTVRCEVLGTASNAVIQYNDETINVPVLPYTINDDVRSGKEIYITVHHNDTENNYSFGVQLYINGSLKVEDYAIGDGIYLTANHIPDNGR